MKCPVCQSRSSSAIQGSLGNYRSGCLDCMSTLIATAPQGHRAAMAHIAQRAIFRKQATYTMDDLRAAVKTKLDTNRAAVREKIAAQMQEIRVRN